MKRIDNKAAAVEACITRHGTIVGPFMTDLTGYPELTPYKGGWCGNDLFPEALTADAAGDGDRAMCGGSATGWRKEGYQGFLEIDVLSTSPPTRSTSASSTRASRAPRR